LNNAKSYLSPFSKLNASLNNPIPLQSPFILYMRTRVAEYASSPCARPLSKFPQFHTLK
jgi:hypothetical protein